MQQRNLVGCSAGSSKSWGHGYRVLGVSLRTLHCLVENQRTAPAVYNDWSKNSTNQLWVLNSPWYFSSQPDKSDELTLLVFRSLWKEMKASCAIDAVITTFTNFEKFWFRNVFQNIWYFLFRLWSSSRLEVTVVKRYQENPTRNVGKATWKNFLLYHFCFISLLGQQLPNMWKTINFNFFEKELSLLNFFQLQSISQHPSYLKLYNFIPPNRIKLITNLKSPTLSLMSKFIRKQLILLKY